MKYKVEVHYENQAVLAFVQEVDGKVEDWVNKCLGNLFFLCRDENSGKFIVCNTRYVTGILINEYSEVENDQRACLDDYRTDKPIEPRIFMPES